MTLHQAPSQGGPGGGPPHGVRALAAAAVARMAIRPLGGRLPHPPADGDPARWQAWAQAVWADEAFVEALEVASPDLAARLAQVAAGHRMPHRRCQGLAGSVLRYWLRMQGRATPFGLFAGIRPLEVITTAGDGAGGGGREPERVGWCSRARVDPTWLETVVARLEALPEVLSRLTVVLHQPTFVRDGRLIASHVPGAGQDGAPAAEVGLRYTPVIQLVHTHAATPVPVAVLLGTLQAAFPAADPGRFGGVLEQLVASRVLITELRAPMTVTDPLGHLLRVLQERGVAAAEPAAALVADLHAIHRAIRVPVEQEVVSAAARRAERAQVAERMRAHAPTAVPLALDLHAATPVAVPQAVLEEAAAAAAVLSRLTPPAGAARLRRYQQRFVERYGPGALVPLLEMVDPDLGLGYPEGYRDTSPTSPGGDQPRGAVGARDAALFTLAYTAALAGHREIVLDSHALAELTSPATEVEAGGGVAGEIGVVVHAEDRARLQSGDFRLVVSSLSRAAGTMTGRIHDLLPDARRRTAAAVYAGLAAATPGALPVQISAPPLSAGADGVARSPRVLPRVLHLAEHPGPRRADGAEVLEVADLAVHGHPGGLEVVSLSRRQPVRPWLFHALELTRQAHPLVRLLCELGTLARPWPTVFTWGRAARLPFLPRVRIGRTVLAAACWQLTERDLPGPGESTANWNAAFARWRHEHRVPETVFLGDGDRRLRLQLNDPAQVHLLRTALRRRRALPLREAPAAEAFGWLDGHAHELLIPFTTTNTTAAPAPGPVRGLEQIAVTRPSHAQFPGGPGWTTAKLYGHPHQHAVILTEHLPTLLASCGPGLRWWYLPYRDPQDHLRLRLAPAADAEVGELVVQVAAWAQRLRQAGLCTRMQFDTYLPELGRYGDGAVLAAAEEVFAADSAVAAARLATLQAAPVAVAAGGLVEIATGFAPDPGAGLRWLRGHLPRSQHLPLDRGLLRQALALAPFATGRPAAGPEREPVSGDGNLEELLQWRSRALATYRQLRTIADGAGAGAVLPSLLHLHCLRLLGVDRDAEHQAHRLARAIAVSQLARAGDQR